ncbi:MAG TPA: diguanylate cyclase [Solirubrobacteraceae bacterium]|nr:diguanylate cyclase [Solirubrobacteraceae bacterium]
MRGLIAQATIHPEERQLYGRVIGAMYLLGALMLAIVRFLPRVPAGHYDVLLILAAPTALTGLWILMGIDWPRVPVWLPHVIAIASLTLVGIAVWGSGGVLSLAWVYLILPAVAIAYFYDRPIAAIYLALCVIDQALPLFYDARAGHGTFLAQLIATPPAYLAVGLAVNTGKRRIWALHSRAELLAAEQSAMRRVATAVVDGEAAETIYSLVASELAELLRCGGSGILRLQDDQALLVVGSYGERPEGRYQPGTTVRVLPGSDLSHALQSGRPVRIDQHQPRSPVVRLGYNSSMVAPVKVGDQVWGVLAAASVVPGAFRDEDELTMIEFGDLLATAIASAEERTQLAQQALTDALTGLANQRALHVRLEAELARASRHARPLSVAMIDIDHFKEINDNAGHDVGDEMLVRVAAALKSFARTEDLLARVGGDEFAWVLPDTTREQAMVAVERARRLIGEAPPDPYRMTVSAGICDTDSAPDPAELIRLADSALYWSKAHGRNQCWVYDPEVVDELSEQQRAERLERSTALEGLRALARTLDNRDPHTREHSDRVAWLAGRLATRAGWPRQRARLLSEAARLHDIGQIASAARPPRPLATARSELEQLRAGAQLSARMVEDVLDFEQARWIREQYDPPRAAQAGEAGRAAGGGLIALADAWDTLTAVAPGLPEEALARCEELVGVRFEPAAFAALQELYRAGELGATTRASD